MQSVKSLDVRENFKEWCNKVINGETLVVSRPKNENVILLSEKEYNEMVKAKLYMEYLSLLSKYKGQAEQDKTISFTMDELRDMEVPDWIPTEKVLNFLKNFVNE